MFLQADPNIQLQIYKNNMTDVSANIRERSIKRHLEYNGW